MLRARHADIAAGSSVNAGNPLCDDPDPGVFPEGNDVQETPAQQPQLILVQNAEYDRRNAAEFSGGTSMARGYSRPQNRMISAPASINIHGRFGAVNL
eukprot:COSAG01_NODE_41244_length_454_cov_0.430986_1_plen_97_part_10